ncbi:protein TIFY 8 isoform X4 [Andrographis paniculata]|uniref:protein TIFY 8 isoform X4 n=1 Tax=Andrographis paniculata TaxID=175694 RepID=UPI0021E90A66|nr:protein TIFY 8 isoform X4 [Andrographis paniculata]
MALAQSNNKNNKPSVRSINGDVDAAVEKPTTFHDFLGNKSQQFAGASCPPPAATDLGSEQNTGRRLGGIPIQGSRGDITGPESSSRFSQGTKRYHSESVMMSAGDKLHLFRSSGEQSNRPHDEEAALWLHQMIRPVLASSFKPQPSPTSMNQSSVQHISHVAPCVYQRTSNMVGPSAVSQAAADEGSKTGVKGSGVLSTSNAAGGAVLGRQLAGVLIPTGKPESSSAALSSKGGTESAAGCSQMTIFYNGQAHVFDSVHPTKADAIMALAGSNGGCWSTSYASSLQLDVPPPKTAPPLERYG